MTSTCSGSIKSTHVDTTCIPKAYKCSSVSLYNEQILSFGKVIEASALNDPKYTHMHSTLKAQILFVLLSCFQGN